MLQAHKRPMHGRIHRTLALAGASLIAFGTASGAQAQTGPEAAAEADQAGVGTEIIVTATRRAVSVQDTPLSVSVTTGETLEKFGVSSFQDLTRLEPSIVVNNQGVAGNQFIIRGILSDIGSTTGFYLDETPLVGGQSVEGNGDGKPGLRLHDIERIEVLKGPQGTLFGSGSMAGTLRIITNKPKLGVTEGGVTASAATIKSGSGFYDGDAYINVPVSDTIAVRAVAWGEFGGNYVDHRITTLSGSSSFTAKDVNDRTVWGGRVSMLFQPIDDFSLLLSAAHQEIEVDDVQSWNLDAGAYTSTSPTLAPYKDNYDLYSATANYTIEQGTFTAVASYGNQQVFHPEDSTPTGLGLAGAFGLEPFKTSYASSQDFDNYTGELRFASKLAGPFQFVVGGYYEKDTTDGLSVAVRTDDATGAAACFTVVQCTAIGRRQPGFTSPGVPASDFEYGVGSYRSVKQWAVYGQGDFEITDQLTATVGIRYYDARVHDISTQIQDIAGPPDFAVPVPVPSWAANGGITTPYQTQDDSSKENSPSYNFSLLYEATPDLSFFARAASGFRIGGTNNAASLATQAGITIPDSYDSDKLWSYELGAKAYLIDRKLFLDMAVYQMDWSKQQLAATDASGAFDYTLNAGKTRIRGAELQATYLSGTGLTLGGGITYTNAKLTRDLDADVISAGTVGLKGDRVPRVPRWTFAGQAEYETAIGGEATAYAQTDFNYRGSSFYSFNDQNSFNPKLKSYFLLGAQAGLRTGPWDLSVFVRNLTDKVAIYGLDASGDGIRAYSAEPRTIGIKVQSRF